VYSRIIKEELGMRMDDNRSQKPARPQRDAALEALRVEISELKRADAEREALLEIMQGFAVTKDIQELLALIHKSIAKVIYAVNFFVVFYNKNTGLFEEVYAVDQYDPPAPPSRLEKSITAYVYRTSQPIIMTQALFNKLEAQGEVEMVGTNSPSWLGTPLITPDGTIGVIVVQDYERSDRYTERDKDFLASIGSQVALAIERKRGEIQLRSSLEEKEILLREVHNRVKNNLNVISSLLSLQASEIKTPEEALNAFRNSRDRVMSMALVHEELYRSRDYASVNMSQYLESLTRQIQQIYDPRGEVCLSAQAEGVVLSVNDAVPCGLILNELVTNAFKYAFPKGEKPGDIRVVVRRVDDELFELSVSDNGIGLPAGYDRRENEGLGFMLVRLLATQIGGIPKIFVKNGTCCRVRFSSSQD
jgi:two-component sensor histidine kinase